MFVAARALSRIVRGRPGQPAVTGYPSARASLAIPCSDSDAPADSFPGTPGGGRTGVNKRFKVPEERSHTLKERALHPLRRSRHEQLHA